MTSRFFTRIAILTTLAAVAGYATSARADFQIFEVSGAEKDDITGTVDEFREAVGPLNPFEPVAGPALPGRRQIDWDAAPDFIADPNPFPGDFFNTPVFPRARGIEFSTDGTGLLLSANPDNPTDTDPFFGLESRGIRSFSDNRLFSAVGSTNVFVDFFQPANNQDGVTHAIGVVFNDVEVEGSTTMTLFDVDGNELITRDVLTAENAGFSFLGFITDGPPNIARVEIKSGDNVLLGNGLVSSDLDDLVVMDDFIFGEPVAVPEPSSIALLSFGLVAVVVGYRMHRQAA